MDMPTISRTTKPAKRRGTHAMQGRFGPANHGHAISEHEWTHAEYVAGYRYEIIDGRFYVSPEANYAEFYLETWLRNKLYQYSLTHRDVVNEIATKSRVFVPNAERLTVPEPDIALYLNPPLTGSIRERTWESISPFIVCEVLVDGDINKDLTRNPTLYLQVPSIREYWILNGAENADEPSLIQYVRRGKRWIITTHAFGATFTTKLLPGFTLTIDPRS